MALGESIRSAIKRFTDEPSPDCFTSGELAALRKAGQEAFPGKPIWETVHYPGEMTLPIHLLPLPQALPEQACVVVAHFRESMRKDKVPFFCQEVQSTAICDQRMGHLWVATIARGKHLPIGQTIFVSERAEVKKAPAPPREAAPSEGLHLAPDNVVTFVNRWWLYYVWIKQPYRNQHIFRNSIGYFTQWHPRFTAMHPPPALERALQGHPEHMPGDIFWY